MADQRTPLPPLDYLLAFEAAALSGGFTSAGTHLNLSQAAVSRKIQLLEHHLGRSLFRRGHRSVMLTAEGERYLKVIHPALEDIRNATAEFSARGKSTHITIAATQSVATLWLMPRIGRLQAAHPDVRIDVISSDNDKECLSSGADLIILRGEGHWPGFAAELLLNEEIFPVCSQEFSEAKNIRNVEDLVRCTLIETKSHHDEWMKWSSWLQYFGVGHLNISTPLSFNTYALSIQAACNGLGVTLGWRHLTDLQLKRGELIRPLDGAVSTRSGYYLLQAEARSDFDFALRIRKFLITSVEQVDSFGV